MTLSVDNTKNHLILLSLLKFEYRISTMVNLFYVIWLNICVMFNLFDLFYRKNEQKRVVLQLKADDLSSDKWAWRKYGQKPIKGSPYPR